jgi:fructokinase
MPKPRVTSIGEILYDVYPDQKRLGGAPFNFIYHVWKIIGQAQFVSSVGNDENGKELLFHLSNIGFDVSKIVIDNNYPTGAVNVTIDENKVPRFKISSECSFDFLAISQEMKDDIEKNTDILYFGTFSQRGIIAKETIDSLLNFDIKYFCDLNLRHNFFTKEMIEKALSTIHLLKMNEDELNQLINILNLNGNDPVSELIDKYSIDLIAVTKGEKGAILTTKNATDYYIPPQLEVIDTLGAGDAFAAVLCLGYYYKLPIEKINIHANNFASQICTINGAIPTDDLLYSNLRKIFT